MCEKVKEAVEAIERLKQSINDYRTGLTKVMAVLTEDDRDRKETEDEIKYSLRH